MNDRKSSVLTTNDNVKIDDTNNDWDLKLQNTKYTGG